MPMIPVKEAMKGVAIAEPEVKEHDVDLLIVGGGMGACGTAFEAVRWGDKHGLKIMLCDKAALERSGAVAQGLSAINTYLGKNSADDYVRMVRTDLMGLVREDLIFDVGRHVDDSVHLFEEWGLPCWIKDENGHNMNGAAAKAAGKSLRNGDEPVRSGRWQIMINGESYAARQEHPQPRRWCRGLQPACQRSAHLQSQRHHGGCGRRRERVPSPFHR